ncbi:MAG: GNAT family N-acetyltransferase, partial [Burkholderiales bacterium]|nr:GNAT family N-acetyltransferase [Burkholderiales bacterium]
MRTPEPVTLFGRQVRLEPMHADHEPGLQEAAADGELWRLRVTSVPEPEQTAMYIANALMGQQDGIMLPFVVRLTSTGKLIGSTRYHDILPDVDRVEIGYTWY